MIVSSYNNCICSVVAINVIVLYKIVCKCQVLKFYMLIELILFLNYEINYFRNGRRKMLLATRESSRWHQCNQLYDLHSRYPTGLGQDCGWRKLWLVGESLFGGAEMRVLVMERLEAGLWVQLNLEITSDDLWNKTSYPQVFVSVLLFYMAYQD